MVNRLDCFAQKNMLVSSEFFIFLILLLLLLFFVFLLFLYRPTPEP